MNELNNMNNRCDRQCSHQHGLGSVLVGLAILGVGLVLTLDNFGMINAQDFLQYWPVFLILAGFTHILRPSTSRRTGSGLFLIVLGVVILAHKLSFITFDVWDLWPLVLVFAGLSIVTRGFRRRKRGVQGDASRTFSATAVMGSDVRKITAEDFQGGEATAIMGGCEVDLRGAGSAGGPAEIDCFAMWGGIEIWVPENWEVQVEGTAILGGIEDKTRSVAGEKSKVLVIRGTVIMAGVEIKN